MTRLITRATSAIGKNREKDFFGNIIGETSLRLTNSNKEMQTFAIKDLLNKGKNINIDPKKHIIDVTEDVTMAKSVVTAKKKL